VSNIRYCSKEIGAVEANMQVHSDHVELVLQGLLSMFLVGKMLRLKCTEYIVLTSGLHKTSARTVAWVNIDLRAVKDASH
jgi:hypothetical protein